MASTARTFTRALRATPASSTFRATVSPRLAAPRSAFRQQSRRGYADAAGPKGNNNVLIGGLVVAAVAGGAGFYFYSSPNASIVQNSADGQKGGLFAPKQEDYQKVYQAIAKRLDEHDEYEDGSYGPVLLRLGWHASGTFDKMTGTGGSNGATMRFPPEGDHGANAGLKAARDFLAPVKGACPYPRPAHSIDD